MNTASNDAMSGGSNGGTMQSAASAKLQQLMQDVEGLVSRVATIQDPQIASVRSKVEESLHGARDALSERAQMLRDRGEEATGATLDFVKENPWKSLGIASLIGVSVALLASRRN
jgi:ElaB/YqjD/DUF883 family membrane-anchored ribosome-binding protein